MAIFNGNYPADIYQAAGESSSITDLADSVGLLCIQGQKFIGASGLTLSTSQKYFSQPHYPEGLKGGRLSDALANEPAVWMIGTGWVYNRSQIATAGHNVISLMEEVDDSKVTDLRFVTGYYRKSSSRSSFTYKVYKIKAREMTANDTAILTIEGYFETKLILDQVSSAEARTVANGDLIQMLGHPLGQPMKYTEGTVANANPHRDRSSFDTWLSGVSGNSGSPVFWKGKVLGIFTGGGWPNEFAEAKDGSGYGHATYDNSNIDHSGTVAYVSAME
ncbi:MULTISPECIES: serine protease [Corallococcus]|nr:MULTISPECIES: serine protease [Corallococcus]